MEEAERVFVLYHQRLRIALNHGHEHFCMYTYLEDSLAEYQPELYRVPALFNLSLRAHCVEATLVVSRLLDRRRGSAGVYGLLNHCKSYAGIFEGEWTPGRIFGGRPLDDAGEGHRLVTGTDVRKWVEEDRVRLDRLPIAGIKESRDKALAHMDREILKGSVYGLRFPSRDEMRECFGALDDVLNGWLWAFDGSGYSLNNTVGAELDTVLAALREHVWHHRREE